jgi:hypothetical protein
MADTANRGRDDFFVGYLPQAPPTLAAWLRRRVALLLLGVAALAALVVVSQGPFPRSTFEFGRLRTFEGWVSGSPAPSLLVPLAGPAEGSECTQYLLVGEGKRGARARMGPYEGKRVRLEGTLVYRDDHTMIELSSAPIQELAAPGPSPTSRASDGGAAQLTALLPGDCLEQQDLGQRTLVGEIVDSKCFFGVMKPGSGKTHRACATRCISGGIPPVLAIRDARGGVSCVHLTGPDGRGIGLELLDFVAEPVKITGKLMRQGDLEILRCDPSSILGLLE